MNVLYLVANLTQGIEIRGILESILGIVATGYFIYCKKFFVRRMIRKAINTIIIFAILLYIASRFLL